MSTSMDRAIHKCVDDQAEVLVRLRLQDDIDNTAGHCVPPELGNPAHDAVLGNELARTEIAARILERSVLDATLETEWHGIVAGGSLG